MFREAATVFIWLNASILAVIKFITAVIQEVHIRLLRCVCLPCILIFTLVHKILIHVPRAFLDEYQTLIDGRAARPKFDLDRSMYVSMAVCRLERRLYKPHKCFQISNGTAKAFKTQTVMLDASWLQGQEQHTNKASSRPKAVKWLKK